MAIKIQQPTGEHHNIVADDEELIGCVCEDVIDVMGEDDAGVVGEDDAGVVGEDEDALACEQR